MSSWDGRSGPNENIPFHLSLLGFAGVAVWTLPAIAPFSLPLLGWVLARWVIMLLSWSRRRLRESMWKPWSGRYYAFEGRQIRIHTTEDGVWVHADDVFGVLGLDPDSVARRKLQARLGRESFGTIPEIGEQGFRAEAALSFLAQQRTPQAHKFQRWLEREVFMPLQRRAAASAGWCFRSAWL